MAFCLNIFKSHKSFDLPVVDSVHGIITTINKNENFYGNDDIIQDNKMVFKNNSKMSTDQMKLFILNPLETITTNDTINTNLNQNEHEQTPQYYSIQPKQIKSPTLSEKILGIKTKQCVKITSEQFKNENTLQYSNNRSPNTTATCIVEATHEHIINNKTLQDIRNKKFKSPKSPSPLRKQISLNYEEIDSVKFTTKEKRTNSGDTIWTKNDSGIVSDDLDEVKKENGVISHSPPIQVNGIDEEISIEGRPSDATLDSQERKAEELPSGDLNPPTQKIGRKEGVISDKIESNNNKDFDIEYHTKEPYNEELIRKAIYNNDFLHNMMDNESLNIVIKAMAPMSLDANSFIIKEGDVGAHFYVSAEGEFEVLKGGEIKKKFGPGEVFGELAILYQARRFASIKVTSNAKVWALERKIFRKIMMKTGNQEREQNIKFLSSVTVLKGLSLDVLQKIGDLLKREFYPTGSTIIRQGDPGDKFYIIRGGRVTVVKQTNKESRVVGILKKGDFFGEQALINQDKRLASIIANDPGTECLTLDRTAFNNYLGTIAELKKKPIDQIPEPPSKRTIINKDYDHIQLDELKTIGTLGVGGFGRVELVQFRSKQTFALKILKKYDVAYQSQIEHAFSEKETMAMCDSTFIVKLFKTYRNNKYIYFLMEACLGGDVWSQLQKSKSFDDKTSKFVTGCVVEAFDYLHSRHIIYRDLKPENLMLDSEGYVKLVDFGFAKRIKPNNKTWTFAGTPEYVAPEIILNKGHDRSVDYWALGVLVHELLVGKPPFRGKDHMKTYNLILRGIDIVTMPQKISRSAQNLIRGLCRQVAAERLGYQKKGIAEIKQHSWFDGFDWAKLRSRSMPGPLKRPIKSNTDLSNFEEYPQDRDDPPDETSGWDVNF